MSDVLPGYAWDTRLNRYRDAATGRLVGRNTVVALLEQRVDAAATRLGDLAKAFQAGSVAPAVWAVQMREEMRRAHLQNIALAKGGWDRLTQADYGRVGAAVKQLYPKIAGTAADVQAGTVTLPQLQTRLNDYLGSARRLYYQAEREGLPAVPGELTLERRTLAAGAQHCGDCIDYAGRGWQPLGTLPVPGQACQCAGHCRCSITYRTVPAEDAGEWIGR